MFFVQPDSLSAWKIPVNTGHIHNNWKPLHVQANHFQPGWEHQTNDTFLVI